MPGTTSRRPATWAVWLSVLAALVILSIPAIAHPTGRAEAQVLGGRQFRLASNGTGSIALSWATGTGQTDYRLNRTSSSVGTITIATLPGTATSYTDTLPSANGLACYQLEINAQGRFAVTHVYDRPSGMPNFNNEGFTMAPQSKCQNNVKPAWWVDDTEDAGHAIRQGTLTCLPL